MIALIWWPFGHFCLKFFSQARQCIITMRDLHRFNPFHAYAVHHRDLVHDFVLLMAPGWAELITSR
jgi:hypothetical protein